MNIRFGYGEDILIVTRKKWNPLDPIRDTYINESKVNIFDDEVSGDCFPAYIFNKKVNDEL